MKKFVSAVIIAATAFSGVQAQRIVNNPDNKGFWGVRASFDVSMPTKLSYDGTKESERTFQNGVGFSVGAIYNLPIVANFYFEPGISFFYNTFKQNANFLEEEFEDSPVGFDIKHNSYRQFGMRIPLNLGYHFDFTDNLKVAIFTGPMLQVGFSCDAYQTVELSAAGVKQTFHIAPSAYKKYVDEQLFNRFDCAWNVGGSITYDKYYLGISGAIGMCNMLHKSMNDDKLKAHMNTLQVTLGYNF